MFKVLVLGDVHANMEFFERACRVAKREGAEWILQVGDFGYFPRTDWGRTFLASAKYELESRGLRCIWIAGNHEDYDLLEEIPVDENGFQHLSDHLMHAIRGTRWEWGGTRFLACGGAYSVDKHRRIPHQSWWPQETITDADVEACVGGGTTDILVTHDVPWGINLPNLAFRETIIESKLNRIALRTVFDAVRPRLVVHGHYHCRYTGTLWTTGNEYSARIEGLAADQDGDDTSWLLLNLEGE